MEKNFEAALAGVLESEGGYVNHPKDPGGPTNLGVTLAVARQLGIDVDGDGDTDIIDIKLLKLADAAKVYRHEYWDKVRGDDLPSGLDYAVFDYAVNSGVSRAAKALQSVVGVPQDGEIGPVTLGGLRTQDPVTMIGRLSKQRLDFLRGLKTWPTFGKGWERRVNSVTSAALKLTDTATIPPPPSPVPTPLPVWLWIMIGLLAVGAIVVAFLTVRF
jgi:lysozyme family protein